MELVRPTYLPQTCARANELRAQQSILSVCVYPSIPRSYPTPTDFYTESGDTMRAAGLHAISTVLNTEAVLIRSTTIKHPELTTLINLVSRRIAGVIAASKYVVCQYNIAREKLPAAFQITPGRRAPTVSSLEEEGWVAVSSMVEKKQIAKVMDDLVEVGAEDILVFNLDNCRV